MNNMKKILLCAGILVSALQINAQEAESKLTSERQNDIMISPIELIAAPVLNLSYERLLGENSGLGVNGMFYLGNDDDAKFSQFSAYYRMYFGKKYASGFFVEGFVPVTTTDESYYVYDGNYNYISSSDKNKTTVGIGVGFGGKWVAKKNIIFEASAGVARRFGNDDEFDFTRITGKGMLGIGYRF